jgi:hypothetical protein
LFDTTYEEFTKKSLTQGKIRYRDIVPLVQGVSSSEHIVNSVQQDLSIKGIKASDVYLGDKFHHLVLDFIGNLYVCSENKIYQLDTDVVDIDKSYYIKQHTIHHVKLDQINMELVSNVVDAIPNNVVKILNIHCGVYILINTKTKSTINRYLSENFLQSKTYSDKISKITPSHCGRLNILFENGTFIECDQLLETKRVYDFLAEDLFPFVVKIEAKYFTLGYEPYHGYSLKQLSSTIGIYIDSCFNKHFHYVLTSEGVFCIGENYCEKIPCGSVIKSIFATDDFVYEIV